MVFLLERQIFGYPQLRIGSLPPATANGNESRIKVSLEILDSLPTGDEQGMKFELWFDRLQMGPGSHSPRLHQPKGWGVVWRTKACEHVLQANQITYGPTGKPVEA